MKLKNVYKNVMGDKHLYLGGLIYTLTLSTMLGILISDKFDIRFKEEILQSYHTFIP